MLSKLVTWIKTASPELDQWVNWVKVNGSRGLGAEIGLVRLVDGSVDLTQAIPLTDRNPNDKLPEIDFDAVDLSKIFLPKKQSTQTNVVSPDDVAKLKDELRIELKQLVTNQIGGIKLESSIFKAKVAVIEYALMVLSGRRGITDLKDALERQQDWKFMSNLGTKSNLEMKIQQVIELFDPLHRTESKLAPRIASATF